MMFTSTIDPTFAHRLEVGATVRAAGRLDYEASCCRPYSVHKTYVTKRWTAIVLGTGGWTYDRVARRLVPSTRPTTTVWVVVAVRLYTGEWVPGLVPAQHVEAAADDAALQTLAAADRAWSRAREASKEAAAAVCAPLGLRVVDNTVSAEDVAPLLGLLPLDVRAGLAVAHALSSLAC